MNKISLYATILAFVLVGGISFYFIKSDSSPEIKLNEKGEVVADKQIGPQLNNNQNINNNNQTGSKQQTIMKATLQTNKGNITIEFDATNAPNTVANFIKLAKSGFYDGTKFHRVIKDFMNQGGDPLSKDDSMVMRWGTGGPGYAFDDELGPNNHNEPGTIAMANSGPNTNGSQFFINVKNNNFLDGKHTVFGKVIVGMDVVMAINTSKTDSSDRPAEPVIIEKVILE